MDAIRNFIKNVDLRTVVDNTEPFLTDEEFFREQMLHGFEKIVQLEDKYKDRPALVMGHGPSLLDIKKKKYQSHLKLTCNDFHKVPNFFDDFTPDFWCAANSYEVLNIPFKICLDKNINTFVTIPRKCEFVDLLQIAKERDKMHLTHAWQWEHRVFQNMLAIKYGCQEVYTHCNTVTNHMVAFALWLGCNPIHVTGFDMSYTEALKKTGMSHAGFSDKAHAGFSDKEIQTEPFDFQQKKQLIKDLKYLCKIAYSYNIEIHNLSHVSNKLPYNLSFRL